MSEPQAQVQNIFGGAVPERVLQMGDWNKSPLKFFSGYDGPYSIREVVIGNLALRKTLSKNFEYMSRNLFFVSAFGRFLLGEEKIDAVLEAEKVVEKTLDNALTSVQRRIAQAETLLSANDVRDAAKNTKQNVMLVPMTTPGSRKYVELLIAADHFYNLNAVLWINGQIESQMKFQNESVVRKEVQSAVKGVANQFGYILNLTRKKNAEKAAEAGNHDEGALAAEAIKDVESLGSVSAGSPDAIATPPVAPGAATAEGPAAEKTGKKVKKPAAEAASTA